ncbi:DMT family transporter [Candidatus Leptofilum sp.]|uniref:DMT family transporter n=1 Tax=Candidatus Leptofilum sp. TaxID=3241576 RepID=UPI003B597E44
MMTTQALPYISFLGFLFGSTLVASRFSVGQFQPTTYIGLRLTMASLGHIAFYTFVNHRYKWPTDRRLWLHASVLGILGTAVPMTSIVTALQYLSSGLAAIFITTSPAITVLLAHFFLPDESLNWRKAFGVVLALSGTIVLAASGESGLADVGQANPLGYILMLIAMTMGGAAAVYIRKYLSNYSAFDVASIRMFVAALVVMPLSTLIIGFDLQNVTATGYTALVYAALVGTFSGLLLAVYNVKRFGATAAAMTGYVVPVFAGLGGVLLLDERITAIMLVGVVLIVAGIMIINRS